jgi:hypothetical protein
MHGEQNAAFANAPLIALGFILGNTHPH